MFDKLTSRERVLAYAVLALVPVTLAFIGIFSFINKFSNNNTEEISLVEQVSIEKHKTALAIKASQRRIYYRSVSLPSNFSDASNDYQTWLKNLIRDEIKMDLRTVTPRDGGQLKYKNKLIGRSKTFTVTATTDLQQLTQFLYEFYSVDLLHRINSIKIIPLSAGTGNEKRVRSGKLSVIVNVEVVSLVDADSEREFVDSYRELARTAEEYQQTVLRRNVFGPANNTPTVTARPSSSYTSLSDIKVNISADDADEIDVLVFELMESQIEGAKLIQKEDGKRTATLEIPGQQEGKYEFKIAVRDNGFPAKINETTVAVTFKDRKIVEPKPEPPPKPKYKDALETRITGTVKDVADNWMVWIKVRTTGERLKLKKGESFKLDDQDWVVESIQRGQATFRVDDIRSVTVVGNDTFGESTEEINLKPETTETVVPESETELPTTQSTTGKPETGETTPVEQGADDEKALQLADEKS